MENKFTPYEVEGEVDYDKLVKQFGASLIDDKLLKKIKNIHPLLKNRYFFAHRDFDKILHYHSQGKQFSIVSGRGPSENMHLAHLLLYRFNKYMQEEFNAYCFFPISDDEKFLFKKDLTFDQVQMYGYENALDIIALGFDPKKTEFIFDTKTMNQELYNLAIQCSKHLNFSMLKSAFGYTQEQNIGISFYPAMQAAHILYPTVKYNMPSLVTIAIDQDVFVKLTRDVAHKLRLTKPATLLSRFMKGLAGTAKMSASKEDSAIFTTDSEEEIERKISKAFTGGRATAEEQRRLGANPDICSVYEYLNLFFMDDKGIKTLERHCRTGKILCHEDKELLTKYAVKFLKSHQKKREKAKSKLDKFLKN